MLRFFHVILHLIDAEFLFRGTLLELQDLAIIIIIFKSNNKFLYINFRKNTTTKCTITIKKFNYELVTVGIVFILKYFLLQ